MHIGTMVEFAFALVAKLDAINKHSFNDFKLRVGTCWDHPAAVAAARRGTGWGGSGWGGSGESQALRLRGRRAGWGAGRLREVRSP